MSLVVVGTDYQVVIPDDVREQLPVAVGDALEVTFQCGSILLRPASQGAKQAAFKELLDELQKPLPPDSKFANMTEEEIMDLAIQVVAETRAEARLQAEHSHEAGH
ncbi:MAG: AbrB/MazE/SpoVT family DNA-binding domain-containing protein [Magnetococcales bacterium]|nr:AbrB/MazE/SpoVT family DNA-binding domain-containing protein [Magnetococcales bacterium]NGZ25362.1 AbrB/MazE/SpoVT family DNA-binding domain-containing protein [Magnetococcales bacterium]